MSLLSDDNAMMLDPRLQEYLSKKKYYEDNDIMPIIPLEQQFSIVDDDIMRIRAHTRGDKRHSGEKFQDFVNTSGSDFPSERLKNDKRFDRLKRKQQKDRDAQVHRHNYGGMEESYDMYRDDKNFASAMGDNFNNDADQNYMRDYNDRWARDFGDRFETDERGPRVRRAKVNRNSIRRSSKSYDDDNEFIINQNSKDMHRMNMPLSGGRSKYLYHVEPRINGYNERVRFGSNKTNDSADIDDIIGKFNTYRRHDIIGKFNTYRRHDIRSQHLSHESDSHFDMDSRYNVPSVNSKGMRGRENTHMHVPFMQGDGIRDIDIDNYIRYGDIGNRGGPQSRRSIGYPSVFEHQFQYISDDMQRPEHVVMERGLPSRSLNKQVARNRRHEREIMP